ncbi:hypothetical protein AB0K43_30160 [Kitasatospora sp. NPDC049258]|uniref:hypothetical protein n=1 Tax=Kitasatospora sp. NPDC049258 TaxID=3155394 RepID=UPI003448409B
MRYPRFLVRTVLPVSGALCLLGLAAPAGAQPRGAAAIAQHLGRAVHPDHPVLGAWLDSLDGRLAELGAAGRLTVPVGLLAVLLGAALGAGHALLPGHGKTVMAAYLAGRRGSVRDAVTVGATVTVTHTAGVLAVGLGLTAFSSRAGETVLGWLGVAGGALVAVVGAGLLREAVRRTRPCAACPPPCELPLPARQSRPQRAPASASRWRRSQ